MLSPAVRYLIIIELSSSAPPLIHIQDATFYENYPTPEDDAKGQNPPLFPNLNFALPSGTTKKERQLWAVIGATGRTQFLDVLRGQYIALPPNARSYPYLLTPKIAQKDPRLRYPGNAIQYIGFSGEGAGAIGGTRGAYLSARYESLREETDWTVSQYLKGQTSLNPLEEEKEGHVYDKNLMSMVITDLRLEKLLDMPVANLSNGQMRRTRIAKALLSKPELLLLDDPFMGLDPATVESLSDLLHRLASKSDPRLILSLRPQDPVPDWITHLLVLGRSNRVLAQGTRSEARQVFNVWSKLVDVGELGKREEKYRPLFLKAKEDLDAGYLDRQLIEDLQPVVLDKTDIEIPPPRGGEPIIEMDGVRVQYGKQVVLGDWVQRVRDEDKKGLHWTVRRGQRWAILGANGSGKTTLLSLITSDHPQAYALPIKLFGRSRLPEPGKPGISIFELQSRIGHSSPEIHAFFPRQLTIRQAVESAFAETFLSKPNLDYERDQDVSAVLRFFKTDLDPSYDPVSKPDPPKILKDTSHLPEIGPNHRGSFIPLDYDVEYADTTTFGQLSTPQQRLVLFLRALVHKPDLIILDEPFSGMSASMRDKCIYFLEIGEQIPGRRVTPRTRRAALKAFWSRDALREHPDRTSLRSKPSVRFTGLSDSQTLIVISHVREEIPDTCRHYMRLPSRKDDGTKLDFRFGSLKYASMLSNPEIWETAWSSPAKFRKNSRRSFRRVDQEIPEGDYVDEEVYEWWSF
ncbi:P-loop containing nucleoside triphosphate hydrolase protein [Aspergillus egyptiacus]|nr:P-loop containing nucleoside triphosphate hydrolase protein [Aspergillus egyptiacus]